MIRSISLSALVFSLSLAGCKGGGGSATEGGATSGAACNNGVVDLSKISGDWVATAPLDDYDGKIPGNQYRIRFLAPPAADGSVKAMMAWRLDSRPFSGTLSKNALGYKIKLLEDLAPDVEKKLREANNQDPNVRMRAALELAAAEKDCLLEVNDNYQSFLGDKTIEKTAMGSLKLTPSKASAPWSFVRCEQLGGVEIDGKTEKKVDVAADKTFPIRAVADPKMLPQGCDFSSEVFVDGARVNEKVPGVLGKEPGKDEKGKDIEIDALIFKSEIKVSQGPTHPVEMHIYGECGEKKERKLVTSVCSFAATR